MTKQLLHVKNQTWMKWKWVFLWVIHEAHPGNVSHLNISYTGNGKEKYVFMYVSVGVSVLTCCCAQAAFLKPPTRVKPWFYRASKREIGCCTAQMYLSLLLFMFTPSLSCVPPVQCVADGLKTNAALYVSEITGINSVLNLEPTTRKSSKWGALQK